MSAFDDLPLAGAIVTVYDSSGKNILYQKGSTNHRGVYAARIQSLPSDFRVTVTCERNCICDQDARDEAAEDTPLDPASLGTFALSADVRGFDPAWDIVYVNPATTLVSRLLDHDPELTLAQAQAEVRSFFNLPPEASLGAALREEKYFHSQYFSEVFFVRQAARHKGIDHFLDELESEILAGPSRQHSFQARPQTIPPALAFIAGNLARAAFRWVVGQGVGWVMQSSGQATPGATPESIENLQRGLDDLQSSVDQLNKQLQALTAQVLARLTETQYNQIVVPAIALSAQINGVEGNLAFYAQGCPPLPEDGGTPDRDFADFCRDQKVTIVAQLNETQINHSFETLSAFVLDNPIVGFKGLPHLYSQSLGETVRFFRPADSTRIRNMFDYWDAVQTQGANLKVELLHLNGAQNNPGGIAQLKAFLGDAEANPPKNGSFQDTRDLALKLLYPSVPVGTFLDTKSRKMWATGYPDLANPGPCTRPKPPPASSFATFGVTQAITWNGISGWISPSADDMRALIEGSTSSIPINWLVAQTRAVAPEFPVSAGFPDVGHAPPSCFAFNPFGWTTTATGKSWRHNGGTGPYYIAVDLFRGLFASTGPYAEGGFRDNWIYLQRGLPAGEQYYWYP